MPIKSFLSFAGFILLIAATYCPLLKPFGLISWDMYDLNKSYGIVVLLVAVIGITGVVFKQHSVARLCAFLSLSLVILLFIAAQLKIHSSFSFIPFKSVAGFLSRQIKFKWGWYLLLTGAIMAIIGITTTKSGIQNLKDKN